VGDKTDRPILISNLIPNLISNLISNLIPNLISRNASFPKTGLLLTRDRGVSACEQAFEALSWGWGGGGESIVAGNRRQASMP
jgi:hypothetical protein